MELRLGPETEKQIDQLYSTLEESLIHLRRVREHLWEEIVAGRDGVAVVARVAILLLHRAKERGTPEMFPLHFPEHPLQHVPPLPYIRPHWHGLSMTHPSCLYRYDHGRFDDRFGAGQGRMLYERLLFR